MTPQNEVENLEIFSGLPPDLVRDLTANLPLRRYAADAEVEVPAAAPFRLVVTGCVAVGFEGEIERRHAVVLRAGDLMVRPLPGWDGVGPAVVAMALEDAVVATVDQRRLDAWMSVAALATSIVQCLSLQVAEREAGIAVAMEPRVERRLLLTLHALALRWGRVTHDGVRLDLRLTHQDLARRIGGARESVTLAMRRLRERGDLTVNNRVMTLRRQ